MSTTSWSLAHKDTSRSHTEWEHTNQLAQGRPIFSVSLLSSFVVCLLLFLYWSPNQEAEWVCLITKYENNKPCLIINRNKYPWNSAINEEEEWLITSWRQIGYSRQQKTLKNWLERVVCCSSKTLSSSGVRATTAASKMSFLSKLPLLQKSQEGALRWMQNHVENGTWRVITNSSSQNVCWDSANIC